MRDEPLPGVGAAGKEGEGGPEVPGGVARRAAECELFAMDALGVSELELCPWALREGIILSRLDWFHDDDLSDDDLNDDDLSDDDLGGTT